MRGASLAPGALALAAAVLAAAGCSDGPEPPEDLVVVVLDALPAGAMGCYGYERDTTPYLDRLAEGSVVFEAAHSGASYTLAAVASLFTALPPAAHGVLGLKSNVLAAGHRTIAEAFAGAGFATAAFSCNPNVTAEARFDQGFDAFRHYARDRFDLHAVPGAVDDDLLAWWDEHEGERRFVWLHLLPPHQPYDPPPPHDALFGAEATPRERGLTDWLTERNRAGPVDAGDPVVAEIRARYDAGLHYADRWVGELVAALAERGAWDRTALIVVSDHGEAFGEHGRLLHGGTVFREETRVPLLVRAPGVAPRRVEALRSTTDLVPTLCDLLGVPWDDPFSRSFAADLRGAEPELTEAVSRSIGSKPLWSLRTDRWTLVEHRASSRRHLFDREFDPAEANDLAPANPRVAEDLSGRLRAAIERHHAHARTVEDVGRSVDDHREQLEELGYVEED